MTECHTQIHEVEPWLYKPPRVGDFFLMDIILRSNTPQEHQEIFNRVRVNMRILTASDIIIADSKSSILPNICEGEKFRASTYNWPETQKLPKKWQQFFNDILHTLIQSQLQNTPLGKWISKGHQQWNYYCDENNDIIARTQYDNDMNNLIPVDIIDKRGIKVIGR